MNDSAYRRWLAFILSAGLVARLALAWLPLDQLITRTLPDDAFIYFVIARHLGAGEGATFDGTMPTNGFHPLWLLALTPIFSQWPSGDLPVHLTLTLSALLDTLTAGLVFAASRRLSGSPGAGLVSAALYAFNPSAAFESVNGLETALGLAMLMLCFHAFLHAAETPASKGRLLALGFLGGLMALSRTDLSLVFALLWAWLVWERRLEETCREDAEGKERLGLAMSSRVWKSSFLPLFGFALAFAPWLAWNQWRVGTVIQSSAVAIPLLAQYRIRLGLTDWPSFVLLWREFLSPVLVFSFRASVIYSGVAGLASLLAVLALAIRAICARRRFEIPLRLAPEWLPALAAIGLAALHTLLRWYPRGWYFAPLGMGMALGAGPFLVRAFDSLLPSTTADRRQPAAKGMAPGGRRLAIAIRRRIFVGFAIVLTVVLAGQWVRAWKEPAYPWQADMLRGAVWISANTPPGAVVGSFNGGILAYFSGRTIVNLDGLTDWEAIRARQQGRLLDYLASRGGSYLLDFVGYTWGGFGPFLGANAGNRLTGVWTLTNEWPYGDSVAYRLD